MSGKDSVLELDLCAVRCAELIKLMEEQEAISTKLLELAELERTALVSARVDDLERSTHEKDQLIERMERVEAERRMLARELAGELGLPSDSSIQALAAKLGGDNAGRLLELRRRVLGVVERLKERNDSNLLLMQKSLDLLRESIQQLRQAVGSGSSYGSDGRAYVNVRSAIMVDCHA